MSSSSSPIASSNYHSASAPAGFSQSSISIMAYDSSNATNSSSHIQHMSTEINPSSSRSILQPQITLVEYKLQENS
ncbi:unnamed protein product [Rotaria sordida]|uniref:Uncharacterized protein n=1 Tax=Rotaria sordida TaxID=392033 RepID=A0A814G642_9BILA|nr:unnamed protein product [Rotaria sordida]